MGLQPTGRPPVARPLNSTACARMTKAERYTVKKDAAALGLSVSELIRRKLGLDKEE